ncbi:MAG: flavin reductase family protein [Amaricoccus sp.]
MFLRPGIDAHGLVRDPFKALVAPRPIGWIATLDADGRANLAPSSFFNAVAEAPPMVAYASNGEKTGRGGRKDTLANIRGRGEFVANVVSFALREAMNATSAPFPPDVDEFAAAGLDPLPCRLVAPPRVAGAPAALECRLWRIIDLPGDANHLVIGEVIGIHIDESAIADGRVDVTRYRPVARLAGRDYTAVESVFSLLRPGPS